jgi:hypothetical protein
METIIEKYNNLQKEILSDFSLKWDGENCETTFRDDVKKLSYIVVKNHPQK